MARNLLQTQSLFWQLTQNPQGVASAIKTLGIKSLADFLCGTDEDDRLTRMEIYTFAYFNRIYESLQEDYPATLSALGEKNFHQLCVDYLQAHPSTNPDLALTSARLPDFLRCHDLARGKDWLADLACIEWENIAVTRITDPQALTLKDLQMVPAESWGRLKFVRIVASALLTIDPKAYACWRKHLKLSVVPQSDGPLNILIWRKDFDTHTDVIDKTETKLLKILSKRASFQEICDHIARDHPGNTNFAAQLLQKWLKLGIVERDDTKP